MAASENEFVAFLQSINLAVEYFERFKETGFDDIDLIKSLEPGELQNMFDMVGLAAKPGHVLKFKKAIAQLTAPTQQSTRNVDQSSIPQKKVQKSKFFIAMHIIEILLPFASNCRLRTFFRVCLGFKHVRLPLKTCYFEPVHQTVLTANQTCLQAPPPMF